MCVTDNRYVNLALAVGVTAVTGGLAGPTIAAGGTSGILAGAAVGAVGGATTSAALGGNVGQGALLGALGGGFGAYAGFGAPGAFAPISEQVGYGAIFGGLSGAASAVTGMMFSPQTPDYSQFGYGAQPYEPQGFSSQHATVTGSGGRQAAAVLAEEIKRSRTLRQRQQEETTAYSVAGELASTGLQIA